MREHTRTAGRARIWAAAAGAVVLVLGGCTSLPEGVDGELTGGWEEFAEPVSFTPQARVCHQEEYRSAASIDLYQPVGCDQPHFVETVHVGAFEGEAAERGSPPPPDSSPWRNAYRTCEERAADYLGADYRHGRLWLGVAAPSDAAWSGGARWFRCDLTELASVSGEPVARVGSLEGALNGSSGLRLGCFRVTVDDEGVVEDQTEVSCDEPHQAEFVGVWRAGDGPYPDGGEDSDAVEEVYEGCRSRIADYTGVPDDDSVRFRVGAIADWMSEQDWRSGDRAFRCRLWVTDRDLTESLEDAGADALPVRTE